MITSVMMNDDNRNSQQLTLPGWSELLKRHPSALLLVAQLMSLILYAVFDEIPYGTELLSAAGVAVLALTAWVVKRTSAIWWTAWVVALPAFSLSISAAIYNTQTLLVLASLFKSVLYFYAASTLIAYMMEDFWVTIDELFAAGATFTLIAWGFAYAYLICQIWFPGSFTGLENPDQPRTFLELLFLSFTTLSATGLGDILPVSSAARVLVMIEEFCGVAYIAVVVSRLIGMTIIRHKRKTGI